MSRCDACGRRLDRDSDDWCPACGAPLTPDLDCWELGTPSPQAGGILAARQTRRHWGGRRRAAWVLLGLTVLSGAIAVAWLSATATEDRFFAGTSALSSNEPSTDPPDYSDATARFLRYDPISAKFGYADGTGTLVIAPRFDQAGQFVDGLAPVQVEDDSGDLGYGYIDTSGQVVIEPRFENAFAFRQSLARVELAVGGRHLFGYIDRSGTMVVEPQYPAAWDFTEGLARVGVSDGSGALRFGFIDRGGGMVIEPAFEIARDFSEGLAAVAVDGRWGYIDQTGDWVIEPCFSYASSFMAWGLAEVDLADTDAGTGNATPSTGDDPILHQARIDKTGRVVWERAADPAY